MTKIVARISTASRKLAVVRAPNASGDGLGYQLRDVTNGEVGHAGTVDGIGSVLGNPLLTLAWAMDEAHQILFGEPAIAPRSGDGRAAAYLSGNERALGGGPEES